MTAPIYYKYHPETGELNSSRAAGIDPKETELAGQTVYLEPGPKVTDETPLSAGTHQINIYNNGWSLIPDYRGFEYYLPDGSKVTIHTLGVEPPPDALSEVPQAIQDEWDLIAKRKEVIGEIKLEAMRRIGLQIPALNDSKMLDLMLALWSMLDTASAGVQMIMVRDIYLHGKSRIVMAQSADRTTLEAYDAGTDAGWPDD